MIEITNLIGACCMCDKIRIDNEKNIWLSRKENPELYDSIIKGKELTHGYCPEDFEKIRKEIEEYKKRKHQE